MSSDAKWNKSESWELPDGQLQLHRDWLEAGEARALLEALSKEVPWQQKPIRIFGREMLQPRLIAWYGDPEARYTYSGLTWEPQPWRADLLALARQLKEETGHRFNSVLLNLYRHGQDSMGWHSDDEPELGPSPLIASISLGATRRFALRHRTRAEARLRLDLPHGSLLIMGAGMQAYWQHALPKTQRPVGPRLNLTFRLVQQPDAWENEG
ncbi:MAG: alpha-ketoglutarate-dependent dioxygenase AlkB [Bacteroidetes bacterium]|nr:MAG: alpha-ketoglutarate-dependent dioxygenase AlkB [Bacteroidota bacterium]